MSETYAPPLDQLLTLGDAREMPGWPDYVAMGFGTEHVPDLIRMAIDPALNDADSDRPDVWAPAHAWRTLAQLHAVEAAAPLTTLFQRIDADDDDFVREDLPMVFGILGQATIPILARYLADTDNDLFARCAAAASLQEIVDRDPEARQAGVGALASELGRIEGANPELNGFIVGDLIQLEAFEAVPAIEAAFAGDRVETSIVGDWEDVQIALGMKTEREHPRQLDIGFDEDEWAKLVAEFARLRAAYPLDQEMPPAEKPKPYRKLQPEPEPAPKGKRRRHHKRK